MFHRSRIFDRIYFFYIFTFIVKSIPLGLAQDDPGDPLFLTPLIKSGETVQAREAALVREQFLPLTSYSGFITVNETFNSNLFFWYFPAEETYGDSFYDDNAPVILFSDGGPGYSCMFSIFNYGPYLGNEANESYKDNPFSWHKKYHMIFLDNPVDVGFSFTDEENGYVRRSDEAAEDIYEFLTQFFKMFPNLQLNKFYNAGGSYGGTYAVEIATVIHQKNLNDPEVHINLQGIIADSPWFEGYHQSLYGDALFYAGLISKKSREEYLIKEQQIRNLIEQEKYAEGFPIWLDIAAITTMQLTGYNAIYDMFDEFRGYANMTNLIVRNATRRALHVGSRKYEYFSEVVQDRFHPNFLRSVTSKLDNLLKAGYRCLVYCGNMDVITGHLGIQNVFKTLTWEHAGELLDGPREVWKDDKGVVGYVTNGGNTSTFVIFRNGGHGVVIDHPERVWNMVVKFISQSSLID